MHRAAAVKCHFDERSEEKSYCSASFKLKVSSLKLTTSVPNTVGTTRFHATLETADFSLRSK